MAVLAEDTRVMVSRTVGSILEAGGTRELGWVSWWVTKSPNTGAGIAIPMKLDGRPMYLIIQCVNWHMVDQDHPKFNRLVTMMIKSVVQMHRFRRMAQHLLLRDGFGNFNIHDNMIGSSILPGGVDQFAASGLRDYHACEVTRTVGGEVFILYVSERALSAGFDLKWKHAGRMAWLVLNADLHGFVLDV